MEESSSFQPRPLLGNDDFAWACTLCEPLAPLRNGHDGGVTLVEEVAVTATGGVRLVTVTGMPPKLSTCPSLALQGEGAVAQTQFVTKLECVVGAVFAHGTD